MKKYFSILVSLILASCTSVKEYNKKLEEPIPIVKLKKDVDFANKKLQKFHPNLYWYITKNQLDYKFDSLKQTIKQPLKLRKDSSSTLRVRISKSLVGSSRIKKLGFLIKTVQR